MPKRFDHEEIVRRYKDQVIKLLEREERRPISRKEER